MGATMARRRQNAVKAAKVKKNTPADLGIKKPSSKVPPGAQKEIKPSKKKG